MLMLSLVRTLAVTIPWLLNFATWMLARSLNMPELLVHTTGLFVFVKVQAVEHRLGKALCPKRPTRRLRSLLQSLTRR